MLQRADFRSLQFFVLIGPFVRKRMNLNCEEGKDVKRIPFYYLRSSCTDLVVSLR